MKNRRIIIIILVAILAAALMGFLWFWFFSGAGENAGAPRELGSAGDRTRGAGGAQSQTNVPSPTGTAGEGGVARGGAGQDSGAQTNIPLARSEVSGANAGRISGAKTVGAGTALPGTAAVPGVQWLGTPGSQTPGGAGGSGSIGGGAITSFIPRTANQLNQGGAGGVVSVLPGGSGQQDGQSGSGGSDLLALGATLGACAASQLFGGALGAVSGIGVGGSTALVGGSVLVYDFNAYRQRSENSIQDCITRTIAKAALQQMTASIVNWISSGYKGSPSFVTNYERFFANVADRAAGDFIRGSALSFLCSPFQMQIRIAVAQSYARRGAQSCTLSQAVGNINSFMNGNFSAGGWQGLLSFTTVPTNNPYGAYLYAQAGLQTAQQNALASANRNLSPGGFLAVVQEKNCKNRNGVQVCDREITTPGKVVESSLETALGTSYRQLELAEHVDQIISAMIQQLMTRTLTQGLSNLSGTGGYAGNFLTPAEQRTQAAGQALIARLQGNVRFAQQFGASKQGAVVDVAQAQQQLQQLVNCWEVASSSAATAAKAELASQNAAAAFAAQAALDADIDRENAEITRANAAIGILQNLQTGVMYIASMADVEAVERDLAAAEARGELISQSDVTQALQDRATIQARMASLNRQTTSGLQQCNAF